MDEAERRFPTLPPQDRYNAAYLSFLTMGIGILFNWNAFVTAADYFVAVYPVRTERLLLARLQVVV